MEWCFRPLCCCLTILYNNTSIVITNNNTDIYSLFNKFGIYFYVRTYIQDPFADTIGESSGGVTIENVYIGKSQSKSKSKSKSKI